MLKTYRNDFLYAQRLLKSFNQHNKDRITLFILAPGAQLPELMELCRHELCDDIIALPEEKYCRYLVSGKVHDISPGYINQEIVKLSFWENQLCDNYMCLDSDAVFIRDFYTYDFMYDDDTPYSVLFEDNALKSDPIYYQSFWIEREVSIRKIQTEMDVHDKRMITCHGFQIFSKKVLCDFKINFLDRKGYTYSSLMEISPYEFSWYNFWLQMAKPIDIHFCGEIFHYYHMAHQHICAVLSGITIGDLARSYVGLVINGNFQNDPSRSFYDIYHYDSPFPFSKLLLLQKYIVISVIRRFLNKISRLFSSAAKPNEDIFFQQEN
jgi:hypothetical protein